MPVGEALSQFPRERTWLLPALQAAQRAEGWLSPETLATVAAHVRVPASEVWGVASHYPELRLAKPGRRVVRVCTGVACVARGGERFTMLRREAERRRTGARLAVGVGTCGLAVGAGETLEALRVEVQRRGLAWTVVAAGCNGMCWAAPIVEAQRDGKPPITAARVTPEAVPRLLHAPAAHMADRDFAAGPDWMAAQRRVPTDRR